MAIGVEVTTSLRSGPSNAGIASGRLHVAGLTERGPVDQSVLVESIGQFESIYGTRTSYASNLYDSARTFFEEGGSELVVSRAVGPGATSGFLVLKDASDVDTVRIEASAPGAHSAALSAEVVVSGGKFTVNVRLDGTLVGLFRNLTSPADLVAAAASNSAVTVTDLGSVTAAPGNAPKALAPTPLSAGTDDRATVTAEIVAAALDLPGESARGGAVAAPGYPASVIGALLIAHAKAASKVALLSPAAGVAPDAAALEAEALIGPDGSYAGVFYPHIVIPDGNGTRTLSPESYVAAVRARAHMATGFWRVPAGDISIPDWILGTVLPLNRAQNNVLAESRVNGIVSLNGVPRLYGWQSLDNDQDNLGMLGARDTLNNLAYRVEGVLEEFVFATIDGRGQLLGRIESAAVGVLAPIANAGGLYARKVGNTVTDAGYKVRVGSPLNTVTSLGDNEVNVSISVRLSPTAALIQAEIIKVALSATV